MRIWADRATGRAGYGMASSQREPTRFVVKSGANGDLVVDEPWFPHAVRYLVSNRISALVDETGDPRNPAVYLQDGRESRSRPPGQYPFLTKRDGSLILEIPLAYAFGNPWDPRTGLGGWDKIADGLRKIAAGQIPSTKAVGARS